MWRDNKTDIMEIGSAIFKYSSSKLSQIPDDDNFPEFAFIGRSNVGKSSLINMLTATAGLAKVSATPGKTRLINHFLINGKWYIVDLPGYGYARVSKKERDEFAQIIEEYITQSSKLYFLFVLIDSRHKPQQIDLEFINNMGQFGVPFGIVFTKCDKQSVSQTSLNISNYKKTLSETWEDLPPIFMTSSEKRRGREEILQFIDNSL